MLFLRRNVQATGRMGSPTSTPIFVNCRDRLESLLALLDFLERAGQEQIYLLDNDSTYPPLLEYY
jgi:hypothetical protein